MVGPQTAFTVSKDQDLELLFCKFSMSRLSLSNNFVEFILLNQARVIILEKIRFQSMLSEKFKE